MNTDESLAVFPVSSPLSGATLSIDEFVPLRFRLYREPVGAGYLRLGNYATTLMELLVDPRSAALIGLTLTSVDGTVPWPEFTPASVRNGGVALRSPLAGAMHRDLAIEFRFALAADRALIFWSDLNDCEVARIGKVQFLVVDGRVAGVLFEGLAKREVDVLRAHCVGDRESDS